MKNLQFHEFDKLEKVMVKRAWEILQEIKIKKAKENASEEFQKQF